MDELAGFLRPLFESGVVRFDGKPGPARGPLNQSRVLLRDQHERVCLDLAGPPTPYNERVAVASAALLRESCWALVDRSEAPEALAQRLRPDFQARRPEDHLSADLTLRYLPGVYRRARAIDFLDPLVSMIAGALRAWPLSGVLAGLDEGPSQPPDFDDQPGIAMLYAERFAAHPGRAWMPAGLALAMLERVAPNAMPALSGEARHV